VLELTLGGEMMEIDPPLQLFGNLLGTNLRKAIAALDLASTDPKVAALLVRVEAPLAGWAQRQALRRAILRFRRSGKPSHCLLGEVSGASYVIASACSDVSIVPGGRIELSGVSLQLVHMKDLFDKIGIRFEELRMGRFKGAVEPLTRDAPSEALREQMHSLADRLYEDLVGSVAENRGLTPVVARSLIDRALFNAKEAKEAGLVDRIEYRDQFLTRLRDAPSGPLRVVQAKTGKQMDFDFSGFGGFMKLMNELLGGSQGKGGPRGPKIAVIYGVGSIVNEASTDSLFGGSVIAASELVPILQKAREDTDTKAVVFRVDSPGGSALASDLIWREVKLTAAKKPIIVSMGNLAASGGYYVSCGATWIVAENTTLTGSIGVIGAIPNIRELSDRLGLRFTSFHRGKRAAMISPYGELSDDGRQLFMKHLREIYDDFIQRVAEGRKLPPEAVASVAEGRVWTGGQALRHGLVDELGGLEDALARARELAGLPEDTKLQILPAPKALLDVLQGVRAPSGVGAFVASLPADLRHLARRLEWVRLLGQETPLMVLPELVRIVCR